MRIAVIFLMIVGVLSKGMGNMGNMGMMKHHNCSGYAMGSYNESKKTKSKDTMGSYNESEDTDSSIE